MFGLANPIHALGRAIEKIARFEVPESPKTTFNVGRIEGGTSVNSIAHTVSMEVDMRSVGAAELDKIDAAFRTAIDRLIETFDPREIDLIAGIEARGFVVASALSYALTKGKIMLRKPSKLPGETVGIDYALEYGTDRIEMHVGAVKPGARVLLVDDLIATGGTALAGISLLRSQGADVTQARFLIDLPDLGGAAKLRTVGVYPQSLMVFEGD